MTNRLTPRSIARRLKVVDGVEEENALVRDITKRLSELHRQSAVSGDETRANIEHEIARQRANLEDHRQKETARVNLLAKIDFWTQTLPADASLVDVPHIDPTKQYGQSNFEAVFDLRRNIQDKALELKHVQRAAPTIAERKEKATQLVHDALKANPPKLKSTHEKFSITFSNPASYTPKTDIVAALAWYDAEGFIARLHAEIDAMPKPALTLSAADKEERIAEIRAALLALEREEEALIEIAGFEGQIIERRVDANPLAVLGVDIVRAARTAA